LIIKLFRKEIVYHIHGKGIKNKHDQNKIYQTLYKWAYRNVHVICLSKKLQYDVDYLPLKKIWFIPNAIRNNNINIQEKGKKNNKIQILFLSNLIISKGILDFIGALKILSEKRNDFEGLIIGKERELTSLGLKNKIKNYEDTIKYIGPKYETEKYIYYRNSDIFVFPSYSEIWGIVILEAMQCGLPVITTNEGAITDMIEHGVNGFIVDKQNPQQIANKIEILIDNPQLRKKMGKLNRKKFIENYTIDKFEYNLISVLKSISESYVKK
jgi:glycosyltransferase involved in cell wall biosynthesis